MNEDRAQRPSQEPIGPRRHSRRAVALDASCHGSDGQARSVELTSLSEGGCSMRLRPGEAEVTPDQIVAVRPATLETVLGVVRWTAGSMAGIEFTSALYPAVVDHLAATHAPELPQAAPKGPRPGPRREKGIVVTGFNDRFGRALPPLGERRQRSRD